MTGERDAWRGVGRVTAFGLTAGVAMLGFGMLGAWLDRALGTSPLLATLLFLAGGGSAVWYGIVRLLK